MSRALHLFVAVPPGGLGGAEPWAAELPGKPAECVAPAERPFDALLELRPRLSKGQVGVHEVGLS